MSTRTYTVKGPIVFLLFLAICAFAVVVTPTILWLLYIKTGFAASLGLPLIKWWQMVVGCLLLALLGDFFKNGTS